MLSKHDGDDFEPIGTRRLLVDRAVDFTTYDPCVRELTRKEEDRSGALCEGVVDSADQRIARGQVVAVKPSPKAQELECQSYLTGVTVEFSGKLAGPDKEFFGKQLMRQVQGRTLYRAFSAGLLGQSDLGDVPFFLCGGGSRLSFYRDLRETLRRLPGYSWLGAQSRELAIPSDLRAEGLMRSDYDRLSVAYGLSMLNLANVAAAAQIPRLTPEASDQWRSHYDKDQC